MTVTGAYDALAFPPGIAFALLARRLKNGHTQADAARAIGCQRPDYNRWESGRQTPSRLFAQPLSKYLRVGDATIAELRDRQEELIAKQSDIRSRAHKLQRAGA